MKNNGKHYIIPIILILLGIFFCSYTIYQFINNNKKDEFQETETQETEDEINYEWYLTGDEKENLIDTSYQTSEDFIPESGTDSTPYRPDFTLTGLTDEMISKIDGDIIRLSSQIQEVLYGQGFSNYTSAYWNGEYEETESTVTLYFEVHCSEYVLIEAIYNKVTESNEQAFWIIKWY